MTTRITEAEFEFDEASTTGKFRRIYDRYRELLEEELNVEREAEWDSYRWYPRGLSKRKKGGRNRKKTR